MMLHRNRLDDLLVAAVKTMSCPDPGLANRETRTHG